MNNQQTPASESRKVKFGKTNRLHGISTEVVNTIFLAWVEYVHQMVRKLVSLLLCGLVRNDVQTPVHLHRIRIDELCFLGRRQLFSFHPSSKVNRKLRLSDTRTIE